MYDALFKDSEDAELDSQTIQTLELTSKGMLILLERQAKDQLPGGKYASVDLQYPGYRNVPTTNTVSERDFGILDYLLRQKAAAKLMYQECLTLWMNNRLPPVCHR